MRTVANHSSIRTRLVRCTAAVALVALAATPAIAQKTPAPAPAPAPGKTGSVAVWVSPRNPAPTSITLEVAGSGKIGVKQGQTMARFRIDIADQRRGVELNVAVPSERKTCRLAGVRLESNPSLTCGTVTLDFGGYNDGKGGASTTLSLSQQKAKSPPSR